MFSIRAKLIGAAFRAGSKIAQSILPGSPGGAKITPAERDAILEVVIEEVTGVLEPLTKAA